jgi:hypothetical protein
MNMQMFTASPKPCSFLPSRDASDATTERAARGRVGGVLDAVGREDAPVRVIDAASRGSSAPWWPAVVVAACALIFTVASFWWLNVRRGRLVSFEPHSFAAYFDPTVVNILLPVIFHNTGAAPIVVQDVRLAFPDEPTSVIPLPWRRSRSEIMPTPENTAKLPAVFAVPGRTAQREFIEFGAPLPGLRFEAKEYRVRIEVELGHKQGWHPLLDFALRVSHVIHPGNFITYSNSPHDVTDDDRRKAAAALRAVMNKVARPAPPHQADE